MKVMCENYLLAVHKDDIIRILEHPEKEKHFSVNINFLELFESDTNLGNALLTDPKATLINWNEAVFTAQSNLSKKFPDKCSLKNNINCRIYNLPPWPHVSRTTFPGNDDADKFLQITGTVVRMSTRKLLEYQRQYICVKCKYPITVQAQYDKNNIIKQPKKCSNPEGCTGRNIVTFGELDTYNCKDYQEISIQEDLSKLGVGTVPNHMIVTLEDELVNTCKPGENVTITGIVTRRWSEFDKGAKIIIDIVLKANHIQVNNSGGSSIAVPDEMRQYFDDFWKRHIDEPLVGRDIILKSISPDIYGLHLVKLAIAIVLAGGSLSDDAYMSTGIATRSESHLLFVGDPGTGKSHMLRFASKIIPRSVLTTGVGSTAAGLTVTAIMENGDWQLEAGALVLADGGICCIDEFNSMREHDRTSIHEAMEQQTISVAKAGMVCKLKTRCSILAACNPKGNIDPLKPLCLNVAMSSPLLSRFDLILLLRDIVNEDNDRELADHLLNKGCQLSGDGTVWNIDKLQAYYAVIKKQNPKLTTESEAILGRYYQLQRKFGSRNKSRTTVRLLESLIRLSQGHAKLMYHSEVQVMDAIFAIILTDIAMDMESSILSLKVDNQSFFDNPQQLYWNLLENILAKLNLDYIFQKETGKDLGGQAKNIELNFSQNSESKCPRSLFSQKLYRQKELDTDEIDASIKMCTQASQNSNQSVGEIKRIPQSLSFSQGSPNKAKTNTTGFIGQSEVVKTQNRFQQTSGKPLNDSKDSGNFSDLTVTSFNESVQSVHNELGKSILTENWEHINNSSKRIQSLANNTLVEPSAFKIVEEVSEKNGGKITTLSRTVENNSNVNEDELDFDLWFSNVRSSINKNAEILPEGIKNKKQCVDKNETSDIFFCQNNVQKNHEKVASMDCSNFSESNLDRPSSSNDIERPKRVDGDENRERNVSSRAGYSFKKPTFLTEQTKNNSEIDSDLDFDLWFEKLNKNVEKSNSDRILEISQNGLNINDERNTVNISRKSDNANKQLISNTNLVQTEGKLVKENLNGKEILHKRVKTMQIDSNLPTKSSKKSKLHTKKMENDLDKLKLMPSVNDDFINFNLHIDWDMNKGAQNEETKENGMDSDDHQFERISSSMVNVDCFNRNTDIDLIDKEPREMPIKPKVISNHSQSKNQNDESNKKEGTNDLKQNMRNPQKKDIDKSDGSILQKKTTLKSDKLNNEQADSSTTLPTTKKDVSNKFGFKRLLSDMDFSKLEEEIDTFEQNFCNTEDNFRWKLCEASKSCNNLVVNRQPEDILLDRGSRVFDCSDNRKDSESCSSEDRKAGKFSCDENNSQHDMINMSQNSRRQFIRNKLNKFAFSKVMVDKPPSNSID